MDMAVGDTRTPIRITAMATIPAMRTGMDLIGEATGGGIGGAGISPRVHMASHLLQQKFGRRVRGVGLL
jgi:hypothetical protein